MSDFQHCPYCGFYLASHDDANCPNCNRTIPHGPVGADLRDISIAIHGQAESAANMLGALVNAQALPLVSLLEGWWNKLNEADKDSFARALMCRCLRLVQDGKIDSQLKSLIDGHFPDGVLAERVRKLIEASDDHTIGEAVARVVADNIDQAGKRAIFEGLEETVRTIAREQTMNHREIIEAAVRDKIPEIEEMTKRIVGDIADDTAREVRARMRRDN